MMNLVISIDREMDLKLGALGLQFLGAALDPFGREIHVFQLRPYIRGSRPEVDEKQFLAVEELKRQFYPKPGEQAG